MTQISSLRPAQLYADVKNNNEEVAQDAEVCIKKIFNCVLVIRYFLNVKTTM